MLDFLILYQHPLREIESICLIRVELERRGYSVDFRYIWDSWSLKYNLYKRPRVVVTSALLNDGDYINFVCWNGGRNAKVLNLQWEQVTSNVFDEIGFYKHQNREEALKAVHISWGQHNYDWLIGKNGVKNAVITGPVHLDFLRKKMLPFYKTRDEIQTEFELDKTKKIILFISSFSFCGYTQEEFQEARGTYPPGTESTADIMFNETGQSKLHILKWIRQLLSDRSDVLFLYRPHPSERKDPSIIAMQSELENFKIIQAYSVKQWILTADKIFTWGSTAIVEAFFAGKYCGIMRPIPLSKPTYPCTYQNAVTITTYDDFLRCLDSENLPFPIPPEDLYAHYDVHETPSYIRLCDLLEKVHSTDQYDMKTSIPWISHKMLLSLRRRPAFFLIRNNKGYKPGITRRGLLGLLDRLCFKYEYYLRDYLPKKEIRRIIERIRSVI